MSDPFSAQVRPARNSEIGKGFSGAIIELARPNMWVELLDCKGTEIQPDGFTGFASIHVWQKDVSLPTPAPLPGEVPNVMLVGDLKWTKGRGGGQQLVDLTRGTMVACGGRTTLSMRCALVSSVMGPDGVLEPAVMWRTKHLQATINWHGNPSEPAHYASPQIRFPGAATSVFLPIPSQASKVILDSDTPALLATAVLELSTTDDAGGTGIKYRTLAPNANGTLIHGGVEFWRIVSPGAGLFGPVWQMY